MGNGPKLANCPKETSRKKSGRPMKNSIMIYGIKNAPETKRF